MKTARIFLIIIFLGVCILLILGLLAGIKQAGVLNSKIGILPDFQFKTIEGKTFKSAEIRSGPVLLIYFNPDCEHCQFLIDDLLKNIDYIKDSKVIMISNADENTTVSFLKDRLNGNYNRIAVLVDDSLSFEDHFGKRKVPSVFIYNDELKLVKSFSGEVRSETLIKYLCNEYLH